jgi:nucleotide-binding universal stress UspA family protein
MTYRNVVVGTDGSPTAEEAVRQAGDLAATTGARLVVVSAYEHHRGDHPPDLTDEGVPAELRWVITDQAQAEGLANAGREVARAAGASGVVVRAVAGDAAGVLIDTAEEFDADAIVVGSRGLTGAARFLGSVASSVAHHAPCDVLVVHTDQG